MRSSRCSMRRGLAWSEMVRWDFGICNSRLRRPQVRNHQNDATHERTPSAVASYLGDDSTGGYFPRRPCLDALWRPVAYRPARRRTGLELDDSGGGEASRIARLALGIRQAPPILSHVSGVASSARIGSR